MTPLARAAVAVGARVGRSLWKRMSNERREAVKKAFGKRMGYLLGGLGAGSAFCIGYYVYHIEETPITRRNRFMMISRQKLVEMINAEKDALLASLCMGKPILSDTHPAYDQIVPVLLRVLHQLQHDWVGDSDLLKVQWTLYVLDSPNTANAVCLPSGEIIVHSGLLSVCNNQDELAFILAHEVAHVLMNHGGEAFSNKGLVDFLFLFVVGALWFFIPSDLLSLFLHKSSRSLADVLFQLPYSRQLEEEADTVGLVLLSSACYEPSDAVEIWSHMPLPTGELEHVPEFLSTHPVHENRLEKLKELLPAAKELWEASDCQAMQLEATSFKNMVNKSLKGVLKGVLMLSSSKIHNSYTGRFFFYYYLDH